MMAQYPIIREHRQHGVHSFVLSVLGYWAIVLGILEVQVKAKDHLPL